MNQVIFSLLFSLYLTKMLIHIDNFDISKLNPNIFNMMKHLICYLDNEWKIKKSNNG